MDSAQIAERIARERAQQGLAATVQDAAALAQIAGILAAAVLAEARHA